MKQRLDETQQNAVNHGAGPLLVTAGPGSGKTTVITHHIKYLIDHLGVSPKEILVITFTKSAATEMKERFLRLCDIRNTEVVFGTFHAFFYQILRQSGGFDHNSILKEKEKYAILRDILKQKNIHFYENTYLEDLLGEFSQLKNQNDYDTFRSSLLDIEVFLNIFDEYQRRKTSLHKIDFDDMISDCHTLLKTDSNILHKWQKQFRYILVDEFQDINPLQYEIIKILAEAHHNLFVVGDEDQSIYSFRGADPEISFRFLQDYEEAEQIFLSVNYRCNREIVEASKCLISHNKNRFPKEIKALSGKGGGMEVRKCKCEQEEYETLISDIKEYQKKSKLSECVILFRTNMISPIFIQELKNNKIPYKIKTNCKEWTEQPVVKDILAYLSLAKGDMRRGYFYRIMNKPVRYISRDMISREEIIWEDLENNAKKYFSVLEQVRKLRQDLIYIKELPVFAAVGYIQRGIGYEAWLREQGGRVYQEGMEVIEVIKVLARECETIDELEDCLTNKTEEIQEAYEEDAVQILTYHGAKGLEWPVVFLPDVVEGVTPYKRAHSKEETEEERRMFYVALTRAKEKVYVYTLLEDERHKKSPSIFIKEMKGD